jgi:penicillin amidase
MGLVESVARTVLTSMSRKALPTIDGTIQVSGLQAPVEIIRDQLSVPHIFAKNNHDMFFAQGFVHAQERIWQMELHRRISRGRMSEVLGKMALDTDRATRTFGFQRIGMHIWNECLDDEAKGVYQAYLDGINACLSQPGFKPPVEFSLLGFKPELWVIEDLMAFTSYMQWQLGHAWLGEITRARFIEKVGEEHASEWEMIYPRDNPTTLPKGIEFNRFGPEKMYRKEKGPYLQKGLGSNVWGVAGWKTDTGSPYFCNDMHMQLSLPGLWFEMQIASDEFNAIGLTVVGIPMILAGHNGHIAWGCTLAYTDCEDLFVEKFDPEDPTLYLYKDEWQKTEIIEEKIQIKGEKESFVEKVRVTCHGPVISDVVGVKDTSLAVCSMGLRPSASLSAFMKIHRAKKWDDFVDAVRKIETIQLSMGYADVDGNIGYWATGLTPIRGKGNGMIPVPGWTGEYDWVGFVPFEDMPHALNPEKGFLVNTNNKIISDDYPYYLGSAWMTGYRARRLSEMLSAKKKLYFTDMADMQQDLTCIPGGIFVEKLKGLPENDPDVKLALGYLRQWNTVLDTKSIGGTFYEVIRLTLVRNLLEPVVGKDFTDELLGKSWNSVLLGDHEWYGYDTPSLLNMLDNPNSWWVEKAGGREAILTKSIKDAVAWLREHLGNDPQKWQWGKIHRSTMVHAMGSQKLLAPTFNRGPFPVGGDTDTPWQAAWMPDTPYDNQLWAPSMRHIFDMGNLKNSKFVLPQGESGHIASKHYDDMIPAYFKGEYYPMLYDRKDIESNLEGKLILQS